MLYYRTHASRRNELPPELVGWESPSEDANLAENVVGEHRVLGVVPPFVFAPPADGWWPLCNGWEIASTGNFNPMHHVKKSSKWICKPVEIDGLTWLLPVVLGPNGSRGFKVTYGGADFLPVLTPEQTSALTLAQEIRASADVPPDMPVRAKWAASLLPLTYALSVASLAVIGLSDDLIDKTLAVAGGYHASDGE